MNIFLIAIAICVCVTSSSAIPQNTESSSDIVEGTVNFKVKNNPDGTVQLDISCWPDEAIDAIANGHDSKYCDHII